MARLRGGKINWKWAQENFMRGWVLSISLPGCGYTGCICACKNHVAVHLKSVHLKTEISD